MTLRFEKNCYPDVNIYRQRKELGLNPIPRKPNVWSRNRSLQHSASDILSQGTARQSTSFCRSFKRQGYRHDLARTKDRKMEQEYCLYTNKISTSDESEYGRFVSIDRLLFLMISSTINCTIKEPVTSLLLTVRTKCVPNIFLLCFLSFFLSIYVDGKKTKTIKPERWIIHRQWGSLKTKSTKQHHVGCN